MVSSGLFLGAASCIAVVNADAGASNWDWSANTKSYVTPGSVSSAGPGSAGFGQYFDQNYLNSLIGSQGVDSPILHAKMPEEKIGLSSMEKVTAVTAVATRKGIRKDLVHLLKTQVQIESMYGSKKQKLYLSASATYSLIGQLLNNACQTALSNDMLWKEQMACFTAYRNLLEIYTMWNGVRDVAFALEHGMAVNQDTLAVCGKDAYDQNHMVSHQDASNRLQNAYLVASTERACYDALQVRIESQRRFLSSLLVSMDSNQDRAQSCIFRVVTVLSCLSAGVQENILDLAIRQEHQQYTAYSFARYAAVQLNNAEGTDDAAAQSSMSLLQQNSTSDGVEDASFVELGSEPIRSPRGMA